MSDLNRGWSKPITGYHLDAKGHWVAHLSCGHNQHVRHNPPWEQRDWVLSPDGRDAMLGFELHCIKCLEGAPADTPAIPDEAARTFSDVPATKTERQEV